MPAGRGGGSKGSSSKRKISFQKSTIIFTKRPFDFGLGISDFGLAGLPGQPEIRNPEIRNRKESEIPKFRNRKGLFPKPVFFKVNLLAKKYARGGFERIGKVGNKEAVAWIGGGILQFIFYQMRMNGFGHYLR